MIKWSVQIPVNNDVWKERKLINRGQCLKSEIWKKCLIFFNRRSRTSVQCVQSRFQRPAISNLTPTFTRGPGPLSATYVTGASASRPILKITFYYIQVIFYYLWTSFCGKNVYNNSCWNRVSTFISQNFTLAFGEKVFYCKLIMGGVKEFHCQIVL